MDSAAQRAEALLEKLRRTTMRRGALSKRQIRRKAKIAVALETQGIPPALAQRIAFQLVFKFNAEDLGDQSVWNAIGQRLRRDVVRLKTRVGLADRQITTVLPKLSARHVEAFLKELQTTDRRIARTILNAALEAAEPLVAGRRYVAEYHAVAEQLQAIDPSVARTIANATFAARAPRKRAMEHFRRFATLMMTFKDDARLARTLAKAAFRARDPLRAAQTFISDFNAVTAELVSSGMDEPIARTLARASRLRGSLRGAAKIVTTATDS